MNYTYSIVYASDFQPIAQDGSNDFTDEKEAFFRLAYMNQDELTVIRSDDEGCIYCQLLPLHPTTLLPLHPTTLPVERALEWVKIS